MESVRFFSRIKASHGCFLYLLCFFINNAQAQCHYSPIIGQAYYHENCGGNSMQNLTGVVIPVYGSYNGIQFTSPLTNTVVITSTKDEKFSDLEIYPNPTFDHINIKWPHTFDAEIFIYTQVGQLISTSYINANTVSIIDINHLLSGYYTIKAVTKNNQIFISKLIKQ